MPKKILNINNFSAGLNQKTSPRDLKPNEYQEAMNMNNETPGKLVTFGESVNGPLTANNGYIPSSAITAVDNLNHGFGLHHTTLDRDVDTVASGENEYLFLDDLSQAKLHIVEVSGTPAVKTNSVNYGSTQNSSTHMFTIDGSTKVLPREVAGNSNNYPHVFEFFKFTRRLGHASTTGDHVHSITANSGAGEYSAERMEIAKPGLNNEVNFLNVGVDSNNAIRSDVVTEAAIRNKTDQSAFQASAGIGAMVICPRFNDHNSSSDSDGSILVANEHRYAFYATKIYQSSAAFKKQESMPTFLGMASQAGNFGDNITQKMYLNFVGRIGSKTTTQHEKRFAGLKFYWARVTNPTTTSSDSDGDVSSKYLLAEIDFEKGIRFAGDSTYEAFGVENFNGGANSADETCYVYPANSYNTTDEKFISSRVLKELKVIEPYIGPQSETALGQANTTYTTSVVINRRVYAGNVTYKDEDDNIQIKPDRIFKSRPNEFDYFPVDSFIDVAVEDGDEIIKLANVGSKLLQFKKNKLFIINCSRDLEFLESELEFKGCEKPYHVVQGTGFVAWFNRHGMYLYDGRRILDLDLTVTGESRFASMFDKTGGNLIAGFEFDKSMIGFLPDTKELIIANKSNTILKYDIKSESYSEADTFESNTGSANAVSRAASADFTNFVNLNDGTLVYCVEQNGSAPNNKVKMRQWNNDPSGFTANNQVVFKSKEYDMTTPSVKKSITTVYINYTRGENILVKGFATRMDGSQVEDTLVANTSKELSNTSADFQTERISVTNSVFKNCTSFGIKLFADSSGSVHKDFTINDIQIVFRDKVAK